MSIPSISSAYLNVGDYVILIDWGEVAKYLWYWKSARGVSLVSQCVAFLIDFLENNADLNPNKTKIIGYSLKTHAASLSARFATSKIGEVVGTSKEKVSI